MIISVEELAEKLKTLSFPVAYGFFKDKQQPPFAVYYRNDSDNIGADNNVYTKRENYILEFYSKNRDLKKEKEIEDLLTECGLFFDVDETYIQEEAIREVIYQFQI